MTIQINQGYTDTPIQGVTSLPFARGLLNFTEDFAIKSQVGSKEIVFTNITCPTDRPELIRLAYTDDPNINKGTGIDASVAFPSTRGYNLLAQNTNILSVTDTVDPSFRMDGAMSAHLVLKGPLSVYVTAAMVEAQIGRLLSALFHTGDTGATRLEALMRGALATSEV